MKVRQMLAVLIALLSVGALAWPADQATFNVRLFSAPRDAAMRKTVGGTGAATATLVRNQLSISGTFEGLRSAATHAEIRQGSAVGIRGPAIGELMVSKATSGTVTGSVTLSETALAGLDSGQLYIQIASESAPDGTVWGWLLR
jgi:hypothetical protein